MNNETSPGRTYGVSGFLRRFFPAPFLGITFAYCILIYYLSSIPYFPIPSPFPNFDKIVHFFMFGGLGAVIAIGMQRAEHEYSSRMLFAAAVGFCMLYGASDEVHQLFVVGRNFDVSDLAVDVIGAAVAALSFLFIRRRKGWDNKGEGGI